jgi:hypothetical protein
MMQVPSGGAFVRALLPVGPTGGYTATFAVWVTIDPAEPPRRPRRTLVKSLATPFMSRQWL